MSQSQDYSLGEVSLPIAYLVSYLVYRDSLLTHLLGENFHCFESSLRIVSSSLNVLAIYPINQIFPEFCIIHEFDSQCQMVKDYKTI